MSINEGIPTTVSTASVRLTSIWEIVFPRFETSARVCISWMAMNARFLNHLFTMLYLW